VRGAALWNRAAELAFSLTQQCHQDPELRLLYVACFAVGAYPSAERTYKPFNPILGETFELKHGNMRYVAEQVRHMD
jgi:Oxysterol-binding protein